MFSKASSFAIQGGMFNSTNVSQTNYTSRGRDLLVDWVATDAFHDSEDLCTPKCLPHAHATVLDDVMQWIAESDSARVEDFILWLFGPAGTRKSVIGKKIAEMAADKGLLIATFFFSRTSPTRNTKDRLIATLAYQLALSIPDTRTHIENAIERDPAIFNRNLRSQINTLLIKPFQFVMSTSPSQITPLPKLVVIDGLDKCNDSQAQVAILNAVSRSFPKHNLPIIFLFISRPEPYLVTSFSNNEPLKYIHRRLALTNSAIGGGVMGGGGNNGWGYSVATWPNQVQSQAQVSSAQFPIPISAPAPVNVRDWATDNDPPKRKSRSPSPYPHSQRSNTTENFIPPDNDWINPNHAPVSFRPRSRNPTDAADGRPELNNFASSSQVPGADPYSLKSFDQSMNSILHQSHYRNINPAIPSDTSFVTSIPQQNWRRRKEGRERERQSKWTPRSGLSDSDSSDDEESSRKIAPPIHSNSRSQSQQPSDLGPQNSSQPFLHYPHMPIGLDSPPQSLGPAQLAQYQFEQQYQLYQIEQKYQYQSRLQQSLQQRQ